MTTPDIVPATVYSVPLHLAWRNVCWYSLGQRSKLKSLPLPAAPIHTARLNEVDEARKSAIIAVCASMLAARKLASAPRSSPAYVAAIADAVADARRIVERIEQDSRRAASETRQWSVQIDP